MTRHGQGGRALARTFLHLSGMPTRRRLSALEHLWTIVCVSQRTTSRARTNAGWFSERFNTLDLQDAKALPDALA